MVGEPFIDRSLLQRFLLAAWSHFDTEYDQSTAHLRYLAVILLLYVNYKDLRYIRNGFITVTLMKENVSEIYVSKQRK